MQFDSTVHISDLVLFGGGILAFLRVWLAIRDTVRDNSKDIGALQTTVKDHGITLDAHGEALYRMGWKRRMVNDALNRDEP